MSNVGDKAEGQDNRRTSVEMVSLMGSAEEEKDQEAEEVGDGTDGVAREEPRRGDPPGDSRIGRTLKTELGSREKAEEVEVEKRARMRAENEVCRLERRLEEERNYSKMVLRKWKEVGELMEEWVGKETEEAVTDEIVTREWEKRPGKKPNPKLVLVTGSDDDVIMQLCQQIARLQERMVRLVRGDVSEKLPKSGKVEPVAMGKYGNRCFQCGEEGHFVRHCPVLRGNNEMWRSKKGKGGPKKTENE